MKMCFHEKTLSQIPGGISLRLGYGKCGGIDAKDAAERVMSSPAYKVATFINNYKTEIREVLFTLTLLQVSSRSLIKDYLHLFLS